jgi:uncharacterized membrane protein
MSETKNDRGNISIHILPTSSNLLGLCFVILTFIKVLKLAHETIIDELVTVGIVLFFIASFFSYVSMRAERRGQLFEKVADGFFLTGLFLLSITSVLVAYEAIK